MENNNTTIRQSMGCGFEPPAPASLPRIPWEPPRSQCGFQGEVTVCPGYTTKLPEVMEIDRMRCHWKVGALRDACDGEQPHEHTLLALEILDSQYNANENYRTTDAKDGGGRQ